MNSVEDVGGIDLLPERFSAKVIVEGDCWRWSAYRTGDGYGTFKSDGRKVQAHRFAYMTVVGLIPTGLVLDHFLFPENCIGPSCVNPDHLRPVTSRENALRSDTSGAAVNRSKTRCPQGHAYDEDNTYVYPNGRGRLCRECNRMATRRYRDKTT